MNLVRITLLYIFISPRKQLWAQNTEVNIGDGIQFKITRLHELQDFPFTEDSSGWNFEASLVLS